MSRALTSAVLLLILLLAAVELPSLSPPATEDATEEGTGEGVQAPGVIEGVLEFDRRPPRRIVQRYPGGGPPSSRTVQSIPPLVYLRGTVPGSDGAGRDASGEPPVIAQRDTTFQPSLLVVGAGEAVAFPNRDAFFHNVFSYSGPARFDLGRYPRGESKSVTFSEHGIVRVYCEVHEFMRAAVVVTGNPHHARPDAEGRFRIPGVPPGTYTLVGWHADHGTVAREVTVPEGGRVEVVLEIS